MKYRIRCGNREIGHFICNNLKERCLVSIKLVSRNQNVTAGTCVVLHGKKMFCAFLCFDNHRCVTSTTSQSFRINSSVSSLLKRNVMFAMFERDFRSTRRERTKSTIGLAISFFHADLSPPTVMKHLDRQLKCFTLYVTTMACRSPLAYNFDRVPLSFSDGAITATVC